MSTRFTFGETVYLNVPNKGQLSTTFSGSFRKRSGETWLMFEGPSGEMYSRTENSFVVPNGKAVRLAEPEKTQQ